MDNIQANKTNGSTAETWPVEGAKKILILTCQMDGGAGTTSIFELINGYYKTVFGTNPIAINLRMICDPQWINSLKQDYAFDRGHDPVIRSIITQVCEMPAEVILVDGPNYRSIANGLTESDVDMLKAIGVEVCLLHVINPDTNLTRKQHILTAMENDFPGRNLVVMNSYTCRTIENLDDFNEMVYQDTFAPAVLAKIDRDSALFGCSSGIPLSYLASVWSRRMLPKDLDGLCNERSPSLKVWKLFPKVLYNRAADSWKPMLVRSPYKMRSLAVDIDRFYEGLARWHDRITTSAMRKKVMEYDRAGFLPPPSDLVERFSRIRHFPDVGHSHPSWENLVSADSIIRSVFKECSDLMFVSAS